MDSTPLSKSFRRTKTTSDSTYSDQSVTPKGSDDHSTGKQPNTNTVESALQHTLIEKKRRLKCKEHLTELSSLFTDSSEKKSRKLSQVALLQIAADSLGKINLHYQHNPLLPSFLTRDELNFLNFEASNAFLFITTIESSTFRVKYVTDSLYRILHSTPEQWLEHDLLSFIHADDFFQVQNQLLSLTSQPNKCPSIKCRLKQGNGIYASVIIDGLVKPVSTNEGEYLAFIGTCYLPLINEYNEKNMSLYKNAQALTFSCRCSPSDWKIFLVDGSVTTFPSITFDRFRDQSILDFIYIDDKPVVHQALLNAASTAKGQLITCRLIYSSTVLLTMILDIKPFFNLSTQQRDFLELIFKNITDHVIDPSTKLQDHFDQLL